MSSYARPLESMMKFKPHKVLLVLCLLLLPISILTSANIEGCDSENLKCQQSEFLLGEFSKLLDGGIDGTVKLTDVRHFPNNEHMAYIDIVEQIAGTKDYKAFGMHLLNGDTYIRVLEESKPWDPVGIVNDVFRAWIDGKAGLTVERTWRTLVQCLRAKKLNAIADNIVEVFKSSPSDGGHYQSKTSDFTFDNMHAVPMLWSKEKGKFKKVFQLLQHVWTFANETKLSGLNKAEKMMGETCHNLARIQTRLKHGNVRVGIIGLTKAGKSTFLNALLGGSFLPSSVLPETANETVIIHDMSKPDGELHCTVGEKSSLLAKGQKKIYQELFELNQKKRNKGETEKKCDKLILYAPLQFLVATDMQDIQLELSDTPGFGEAGVKNITDSVNIAVRELCAFIWILNSNNLKSVLETTLLKELQLHHSELFSELNRVLILVNVHTDLYKDSRLSSNAISPEELPKYVSEYFENPDILDFKIAPEKIKLFHALWALKSREWNKTKALDPDHKKANMLYKEAMLMLRYLYEDNAADIYEKNMNDENIKSTVDILQKGSNIEEVETLFKRMVIDNGGLVLLGSAVYDTISILTNSFEPVLKTLFENEHIDTRKEELQSAEQLDNLFQKFISQIEVLFNDMYSSIASSTQAHVFALHDTVRESLSNVISSELMEGLKGLIQVEDKTRVAGEMQIVRDTIPTTALVKIKNSWLTVTNTIRNGADSQLRSTFSNIRSDFLSSLGTLKGKAGSSDYAFHVFVEDFSVSVSSALVSVGDNTTSLVPASTSLVIDELALSQNKAIQNSAINSYIQEEKQQKFKTKKHKTCGGGIFGMWKRCIYYNEAIPYDQAVFSPNLNAFKTAFDDTISAWVNLYDKHVEDYLHDISISTGTAGKSKLINILQGPQQRVTELLHSRQKALKTTKQNISFLKEKQDEIYDLKKNLQNSIK